MKISRSLFYIKGKQICNIELSCRQMSIKCYTRYKMLYANELA